MRWQIHRRSAANGSLAMRAVPRKLLVISQRLLQQGAAAKSRQWPAPLLRRRSAFAFCVMAVVLSTCSSSLVSAVGQLHTVGAFAMPSWCWQGSPPKSHSVVGMQVAESSPSMAHAVGGQEQLPQAPARAGRKSPLYRRSHTHHQNGGLATARAAAPASAKPSYVRRVSIGAWVMTVGLRSWSRRATTRLMSSTGSVEPLLEECPPPILYPQRWVQLAFLALLALLSDLVCFSVAAVPQTWVDIFGQDPATLIDIFLFTNVAACFLEPFLIRKFGLRIPIVGAAILMAVGCALRSGVPFIGGGLPSYMVMVMGTMLVAVAQPFFQCTPPLLSATWFAPDERALATAVAINFNQVGIATAFILGGELGRSEGGLKEYFGLITVAAFVVAGAAAIGFREKPPTPPSASEAEKEAEAMSGQGKKDVGFLEEAGELLQTPGFLQPLFAFVVSITVTNVVGAFMEQKLRRAGIGDQSVIDLSGAGFELAIVIGGIFIGSYVDRSKEYKSTTLACLAATLVVVGFFGLGHLPPVAIIAALLAIGTFAGPVQPVNAELAVEVTYPADENAIEAVQQLCGNLVSALLVPLCEWAAHYDFSVPAPWVGSAPGAAPGSAAGTDSVQGDTVLLLGIVVAVAAYFLTFDAPLRRTEVDLENCVGDGIGDDDDELELTMDPWPGSTPAEGGGTQLPATAAAPAASAAASAATSVAPKAAR